MYPEKNHNKDESFKRFTEFITERDDIYKYLHNTDNQDTAKKILTEGFDFESHLDYTTDMVTGNDPIEIKYFIIKRKRYGLYTILIQIAKSTVNHYSKQLKNSNYHFSEILTFHEPVLGENDEPVYKLPVQFIKGYFDHNLHQPVLNESFDPYFRSPIFDNNLKKYLDQGNLL